MDSHSYALIELDISGDGIKALIEKIESVSEKLPEAEKNRIKTATHLIRRGHAEIKAVVKEKEIKE